MASTLNYFVEGNLCSCINVGNPATVNETIRVYLISGKYDKDQLDGKITSITPTTMESPVGSGAFTNGNLYTIEFQDEAMPTGVAVIEACDIANIGCPGAVNNDYVLVTIVSKVEVVETEDVDCFDLKVTKRDFLLVGQTAGDIVEETDRFCIQHPYPYSEPEW